VKASAAEEAGLRDGQKLLGWSIHGDAARQVELTVAEGSGARSVRYLPHKRYPAGQAPAPIPRFELTGAGLAEPEACRL
jgi:hypothetical protein